MEVIVIFINYFFIVIATTLFPSYGRRGRSGDSAYSIVCWTPKDCQTGDWIAIKSPPFMIRNNRGTLHW